MCVPVYACVSVSLYMNRCAYVYACVFSHNCVSMHIISAMGSCTLASPFGESVALGQRFLFCGPQKAEMSWIAGFSEPQGLHSGLHPLNGSTGGILDCDQSTFLKSNYNQAFAKLHSTQNIQHIML